MNELTGDEMTGPTDPTDPVVVPGIVDAQERAGSVPADVSLSQADELERAIQAFLADMGSGVVSVSRVVNPLLQVWSVARDVDADVAVPVENLLTVLVGRSLTTSQELTDTMTEVRAVLASTTPLATV